eukprot:scaffold11629_cov131-Isochrysis_galbana.AAC.4
MTSKTILCSLALGLTLQPPPPAPPNFILNPCAHKRLQTQTTRTIIFSTSDAKRQENKEIYHSRTKNTQVRITL